MVYHLCTIPDTNFVSIMVNQERNCSLICSEKANMNNFLTKTEGWSNRSWLVRIKENAKRYLKHRYKEQPPSKVCDLVFIEVDVAMTHCLAENRCHADETSWEPTLCDTREVLPVKVLQAVQGTQGRRSQGYEFATDVLERQDLGNYLLQEAVTVEAPCYRSLTRGSHGTRERELHPLESL